MMDQFLSGADDEVFNWVKKSKMIESIVRIPGDASARKYYRICSRSASYVVMRMEPFLEQGKNLSFLVVQNHLKTSGVHVPQILDIDPVKGFILLEDLGDMTLLKKLQTVIDPNAERLLYQRAIDGLVQLQIFASPHLDSPVDSRSIEAFQLRFDQDKLMWEVQFTLDHFYQLYLKRNITEVHQKAIISEFSQICTILANEPTVLTHRDFHSRNLMVVPRDKFEERFVMIDFQDARMGPSQYDLASLLKDSYYQLEETQVQFLIQYYLARYEALSHQTVDHSHFLEIFDFMSIQRNFKAIGSFASFLNRRGDPSYLKYIGNTFENIRRTLLKYPQYSSLRELLFHYYYF